MEVKDKEFEQREKALRAKLEGKLENKEMHFQKGTAT